MNAVRVVRRFDATTNATTWRVDKKTGIMGSWVTLDTFSTSVAAMVRYSAELETMNVTEVVEVHASSAV